jgi:hypothetical protein
MANGTTTTFDDPYSPPPPPSPTPTRSPTKTPTPTPTPTPTDTPTPTVTPTGIPSITPTPTPEEAAMCVWVQIYDLNWEEITDFSDFSPGDEVYFAVYGSSLILPLNRARFRINGGFWIYTNDQHSINGFNVFYISYTLEEEVYHYLIEAEVRHPELGWL